MPSPLTSPSSSRPASPARARCAVVTGSSSGIGAAVATRLLVEGWRVHGVDVAEASLQHAAFQPQRLDLRAPDAAATAGNPPTSP